MGPQGMGPQGMGPQGMGPQGMGPQGMGPQGMGPQGRGPRGMGLGPAGPHGQAHPGEKPLGPPGDVKDADQEQMRELLKGLRSLSPSGEPMPWIEMLESFAPADGSDGDAAEKIQELLKGLGIDMRGAEASSRQVRVRLVRPEGKKKDGESEILIDEVVEDAPEKIKSKK
jgi:hypothetical protein